MTDEDYFLLYEKHLRGQCSPAEERQLRAVPQAALRLPDALLTPADKVELTPVRAAIWGRLRRSLRQARAREQRAAGWRRWSAAAAVLALLVAGGWWGLPRLWPARVRYATTYGEQRRLTLPDGSQVVLNGNSTLETAAEWGARQPREVWLRGEAYFSVAHLAGPGVRRIAGAPAPLKFVVHSGRVDVSVLGTKFNVNSRPADTRVVLTSGSVQLTTQGRAAGPALLLRPGDLVQVQANQLTYTRKRVNPALYTAWKEHHFVFDDTPLPEISRLLEDTYGYTVVLEDPALLRRKLTGTIDTQDPQVLLYALAKSFNIRVCQQQRTLRFSAIK